MPVVPVVPKQANQIAAGWRHALGYAATISLDHWQHDEWFGLIELLSFWLNIDQVCSLQDCLHSDFL